MFIQGAGGGFSSVHHMHMTRKTAKKTTQLTLTHLREWREFRKITLEDAGAEFGITHGQLSKIERGVSPYNQRLLEAAARLYGCTVIDLLTRGPNEAQDLFSAYAGLDQDGKRQAARLVDALRKPHR
jgi:transcriptional regulator with XRE-family HTH domain